MNSDRLNIEEQSFKKASLSTEERVESLLSLMTLEEKVGQLVQVNLSQTLTGPAANDSEASIREGIKSGRIGALLNLVSAEQSYEAQQMVQENTRLKIPLIIGYDVIHGHKTMFPVPIGLAASWDTDAIELSAKVAAREAASQGIHWTFSPMVDISRDARWGRIMESGGEDPYLSSKISAALVKGYQGDLSDCETIAACAKHLAGYGFAEAGRDYNTTEISLNTLQNIVLPPFKAAVDAGVATIMNSYNELNGQPATANAYLQRKVLKGDWGFDGFVVSDWNSIGEMIQHGYASDKKHAAEIAIRAGSDMDMMTYAYHDHLEALVADGIVDLSLVDEAVKRVLRVKFRLGLFEDPFAYSDIQREKTELLSERNLEASRSVAETTMVLLKNDAGLLPLAKEVGKIGLIGPLADHKDVHLGNWRAQAVSDSAVSIKEGLENALADQVKLLYAQGCELSKEPRNFYDLVEMNESDQTGFDSAIAVAQECDLVILALGEDCFQSGEARSRVSISLPEVQIQLLEEVQKVNPNVIVLIGSGRPIDLSRIDKASSTILLTWQAGSEAGNAIANVLTGKRNPSGKLPSSFPRSLGQLPLYYNRKSTGRPTGDPEKTLWSRYIDSPNDALYPFGYGIGYSEFVYSNFKLDRQEMNVGGSIEASIEVTNSGKFNGDEVVQLYIRDHLSSTVRPVKELKAFEKVEIAAKETKRIKFTITEKDLMFFTANEKWEAEPGKFSVMVGGNSVDLLEEEFELIRP